MNVLLVSGKAGVDFLIKTLRSKGHNLTVIDRDPERCRTLEVDERIRMVCGTGTDVKTLQSAMADRMDIVIALDEDDSVNIGVCVLAKKRFHVKYAYSIVNDPDNIGFFKKAGIDSYVSTARQFDDLIERNSLKDNIKKYLPAASNTVVICEADIGRNSPALNKKLWEMGFPPPEYYQLHHPRGRNHYPPGEHKADCRRSGFTHLVFPESGKRTVPFAGGKRREKDVPCRLGKPRCGCPVSFGGGR